MEISGRARRKNGKWQTAAALVAAAALGSGCAPRLSAPAVQVGTNAPGAPIDGLDRCERDPSGVLHLDPSRPLTVFVHGCHDTGGRFHELAQAFEERGQQAACFNYRDRESFEETSGALLEVVEALEARLPPQRITIVAHSQGGLIARRAFTEERAHRWRHHDGFTYRLFTVSAPFGGIDAASACSKTWMHFLSLGVTAAVCNGISGNEWDELPPTSAFIQHPGTLVPQVEEVTKVVTDERGACRTDSPPSTCKSDEVFSVEEQTNPVVDGDARLHSVTLRAGHVGAVGGDGVVPEKLIAVLEGRGILSASTSQTREGAQRGVLTRPQAIR